MRSWRLALYCLLICLPALLIIGVGGVLIAINVPKAVRAQPSRIGREYREMAEDFIAHPARATFVGKRKKGWRQVSKINGVPWGYEHGFDKEGRRTRIWFESGSGEWRSVVVPAVRPFPCGLVFYGGGLVVALTLIFLSALAVRFFVRFVKSRDDFLAATAHDLTTPLVGLRMMIGRDDEEAKKLNERMLLIVNNIKDFLRLGGRRRPELKPVDIAALVREAYQLFAADYEDAESGAVQFKMAGTVAKADETMTLQILWNLFGNDLKYAAPYGKVEVRMSADEKMVKVELADEGPGMTPRQMRRAFDRYYRAKTALQSGKGGFGIGLCTAREFARAMGGDLTVRANEPRGCIFTLSLPRAFVV